MQKGEVLVKNSEKIVEGYMPYLGFQTYYRIVGEPHEGRAPLILLHGGPGGTQNYFQTLDRLADDGRQLIMYDQIGCGKSFVEGHEELWHSKTWINELIELRRYLGIDQCHLLGQSWGGMMIIEYMCDCQPEGVLSNIVSSGLPSTALWAEEQHRMLRYLPQEEQDAVLLAEETKNYDDPMYQQALAHYMSQHGGARRGPDAPECVRRPYKDGELSYLMTQGVSEFGATGNFVGWEYRDKLHTIKQPTLIMNGSDDLCTPVVAKCMADGIPNSEWHMFVNQRHSCYVEANGEYCELVGEWLRRHDPKE